MSRAIPSTAVVILANSAGTVMSVFLVAVMIGGFVVLWALWHFVFRKAPPDDPRREDHLP